MKFTDYVELLVQRMEKYFDIEKNSVFFDRKYEIKAEFLKRETQTFIFKNNVMDFTESREICLVRTVQDINDIKCELEQVEHILKETVNPSRHHQSTIVTLVLVHNSVSKEMASLVKKFRFRKLYKMGFWGWSEGCAVLVDLNAGKVHSSVYAREKRKFFSPDMRLK